ncbi:hypothetical protein V3C99_007979, partial [Haemonchus contortus]
QSDDSDEDDDGNETLTTIDAEKACEKDDTLDMNMDADQAEDLVNDKLMITDVPDSDVSPYQLRSRLNVDDSSLYGSLHDTFTEDNFDPYTGYHEHEMLTFVENPDYLNFLQGIQASTPIHGNGNTLADDDDPDDEEYNVLGELENLSELERDRDELRKDKFTEIPLREVEGLLLDLIGDKVEEIRPELMPLKDTSPKKKRSQKHRSVDIADSKQSKNEVLPVDEPPPDGSYSCSLINGKPITFKVEELEQLRIQMEQHVQLLTQSVVMCYHDSRMTHMTNTYQLMINELDSRYYAGGSSSFFNIGNLAAAIESCHDIMGVSPVSEEHVRWDPTPFGWSPRPEAALVLGRSRAVIYPDLLPGVQPDLFEFNHQFFTAGEDLLLAHALVQFRHLRHSNSQDPFGRLYWVQKMLLPCKTTAQIRSHLRVARQHYDGEVANRNPLYQIIVQALRGVCHLRFPFQRPLVRFDTLQMWPEEERPIWYNKFLKHFVTIGPTVVIPAVLINDGTVVCPPPATFCEVAVQEEKSSNHRKSSASISGSCVSYEVDVSFCRESCHIETGATALPISYLKESARAGFYFPYEFQVAEPKQRLSVASDVFMISGCDQLERVNVKDEGDMSHRAIADLKSPAKSRSPEGSSLKTNDRSLNNPNDLVSGDSASPDGVPLLQASKPRVAATESDTEFSVYEPDKEFDVLPLSEQEELQVPKSEFSVDMELEEGEIISPNKSRGCPASSDRAHAESSLNRRGNSHPHDAHNKRARSRARSRSPARKRKRKGSARRTSSASGVRHARERESTRTRIRSAKMHSRRNETNTSVSRTNARRQSSSSDRRRSLRKASSKSENSVVGTAAGKSSKRAADDVEIKQSCKSSRRGAGRKSGGKRVLGGEDDSNRRRGHSRDTANNVSSTSEKLSSTSKVCTTTASDSKSDKIRDTFVEHGDVMEELRVEVDGYEPSATIVMDKDEGLLIDVSKTVEAGASPVESLSCAWKDSDFDYEDYGIRTPRQQDTPAAEFNSPFIPKTPTFNTPSDYSPLGTAYQLSRSSPGSDLGVPVTPRDDARTRSPTLLRAPSAVSRALFAKVEIKRVPTDAIRKTDLTGMASQAECWKEAWDCTRNDPGPFDYDYVNMRASSAFGVESVVNDYSEDALGSEMYTAETTDEMDAAGKTRMKRRTRTEKERMGLECMQSPHHRFRQMNNLARKIALDVKHRTFMHQDIWRTVERIVLGSENLEAQFDRLTTVLLPDHADVLVLLSLLADEAVLPPELLTSSLRRAYHGAIQMLLAIEAYCHGTRSRSSNTRSLLKTIGSMGQTLSESEFCDRLADLLGNERPLWNYIRQWLPLPYDEKVAPADFEFIDLCKRSNSELLEDKGAECIDDLSAVLGTPPPRKGGPLQVTGGQLNSLQNGVYVPIMISKEKSADEVPVAAQTENH